MGRLALAGRTAETGLGFHSGERIAGRSESAPGVNRPNVNELSPGGVGETSPRKDDQSQSNQSSQNYAK